VRDQMTKAHCVVTGSADGSHKELRPRHWEEGEDADRLKQKIRSGELPSLDQVLRPGQDIQVGTRC